MSIKEDLSTLTIQINSVPMWRKIIYGIILIFVLGYLGWSVFHKPSVGSGSFQIPPQIQGLTNIPKVPGSTLIKPLQVIPKPIVQHYYPDANIASHEEVIDTADIPPSHNGHTAIVTMDTTTSTAHTQIKEKPAPWFALERGNAIGGGVEQHFNGDSKAKVYYNRDLFRIKDMYIKGEIAGKARIDAPKDKDRFEGYVGAYSEWRF
jgi:hypothetical protein